MADFSAVSARLHAACAEAYQAADGLHLQNCDVLAQAVKGRADGLRKLAEALDNLTGGEIRITVEHAQTKRTARG